ncbi:aldose epimerase family protein [Thalassotalea marina]|uniref:Aldose 1-epimerase n=1 Tax=Thalassotalea marina TaxID=1673741 RepID=A0A919EHK7_9GAMM|nr:aldose epimerase family protein [Thalassotalea marina]GHF79335.1 aldose 1-epimerase [Thalassotalea marina]
MSTFETYNVQRLSVQPFGQTSTGQQAKLFILTNKQGMRVAITDFGAAIVSIFTPDKTGRLTDIVLGYDNVSDYQQDTYYLGAVVGRYAGRIDQGKISIDNHQYQLTLNTPDSQLHGGHQAFNKVLWHVEQNLQENDSQLTLTHISPDGDNGFPGEVRVSVTYLLTDDNELVVKYHATTNKTTLLNLTQHSYFNLAGHDSGQVHHHQIKINACHYLPMDKRAFPTGEIKAVKNTAHDFLQLTPLAKHIDSDDEQIQIGRGFDNYWLVDDNVLNGETYAAQAVEPISGRVLTMYSDQPSLILYTANYIDGSHYGKNNVKYQKRGALCLEPQRANNRQNGHQLSNTLLEPNEPFNSTIRYCFSVQA